MAQGDTYYAHSENRGGRAEPLREHLSLVADRARGYADVFGRGRDGYLAGLLHDIGKYGDLFQKRLKGEESGIDHWSGGAWLALTRYRAEGVLPALAIQGHHIGLQSGSKTSLRSIDPSRTGESPLQARRPSETDVSLLESRLLDDGLTFPSPDSSLNSVELTPEAMLDARMLFSALADADFIETEAHFNGTAEGPKYPSFETASLEPAKNLEILLEYLERFTPEVDPSDEVKLLRKSLLLACLSAADNPTGLFTLTAPTGSGKTLSLLAFALRHAALNNLERLIVVIPYLTIIEQTAGVYRKALAGAGLDRHVLEHHSMAGIARDQTRAPSDCSTTEARLAQNWESPVVITTSVQFLESLFSNRSSACRKLHNIPRSMVVFDEVQTLPLRLAIPTLATLSQLSERYFSTVVFSTATQPAFSQIDEAVKVYCRSGWSPREIVPPGTDLFSVAPRVRAHLPQPGAEALSVETLASELAGNDTALCILNMKRHALAVFDQLKNMTPDGVFHLSTSMCPAHRSRVLDEVKERLRLKKKCRLVSTQCVEAGVDIDFPVVFRARGPLDSIAQAAGRCNRNGLAARGDLYIFAMRDEEDKRQYPDAAYTQAAAVANIVLNESGGAQIDIDDPELYARYYSELYKLAEMEQLNTQLLGAMKQLDFVEVSSLYRLIDSNTINVLVPFDKASFERLVNRAREQGLTRDWLREARPHTVSIFAPRSGDIVQGYLEPVPTRDGPSEEWFIYMNKNDYDMDVGLRLPADSNCWIS